ncbi:MAG TPA: NAD-dependent epimerase/dehydratase family protein [Vicinamibacterales bacterium]
MTADVRVLVTGGAGYIGSVLVRKLLARNVAVTVLDNLTYTDAGLRDALRNDRLRLVAGDVRDRAAVRDAMRGNRVVVHLAAIANDPSGELDPQLTEEVNFRAYDVLIDEARRAGVDRFLNASTFGVYGRKDEADITEDAPLLPLKAYSACKARSESTLRAADDESFATVSLRCATVCGFSPRLRLDLIVNTLTAHAVVKGDLVVFGGEQQRPQIHIDDLTDYFVALIDMRPDGYRGRVYNAGGQNVTIREIAETVRDVVGRSVSITYGPVRDDERTYHVNSDRIRRELGLAPRRSVRDAIQDLVDAYRSGLWSDPESDLHHNVARMKRLGVGPVHMQP